jgi:hypothetical protein
VDSDVADGVETEAFVDRAAPVTCLQNRDRGAPSRAALIATRVIRAPSPWPRDQEVCGRDSPISSLWNLGIPAVCVVHITHLQSAKGNGGFSRRFEPREARGALADGRELPWRQARQNQVTRVTADRGLPFGMEVVCV